MARPSSALAGAPHIFDKDKNEPVIVDGPDVNLAMEANLFEVSH